MGDQIFQFWLILLKMTLPYLLSSLLLLVWGRLIVVDSIGCLKYGIRLHSSTLIKTEKMYTLAMCQEACMKMKNCYYFSFNDTKYCDFHTSFKTDSIYISSSVKKEVAPFAHTVAGSKIECNNNKNDFNNRNNNVSNILPIVSVSKTMMEYLKPYCKPMTPYPSKMNHRSSNPIACTSRDRYLIRNVSLAKINHNNSNDNNQLCLSGTGFFNQYDLEAKMLQMWTNSLMQCGLVNYRCAEKSNIIIIPSFLFTCLESRGEWFFVTPKNGTVPSPPRANPLHSKHIKWHSDHNFYEGMWNYIRKSHIEVIKSKGIFIMHISYVFDSDAIMNLVRALLQQPDVFKERVILVSIESNLQRPLRRLLPSWWEENGILELERRRHENAKGLPLLLTLPYPTTVVSVPSNFEYQNGNNRPLNILLLSSRRGFAGIEKENISPELRGRPMRGGSHNKLRPVVRALMEKHKDGKCFKWGCLICQDCDKSKFFSYRYATNRIWEISIQADFCVEPHGDTLTRSHFYVAVQTGCIPVLFDGGGEDYLYSPEQSVAWAWRKENVHGINRGEKSNDDHDLGGMRSYELDYSKFAVFFNASEVVYGQDFTQKLLEISNNKDRMRKYRKELAKVAPRFTYKRNMTENNAYESYMSFVVDLWNTMK